MCNKQSPLTAIPTATFIISGLAQRYRSPRQWSDACEREFKAVFHFLFLSSIHEHLSLCSNRWATANAAKHLKDNSAVAWKVKLYRIMRILSQSR